tara:strand:+ start:39674 stop:40222 length:549 start_codon:yes stop_codon:yes gene_type:complete
MPLTREMKIDLMWDKMAINDLMNSFGRALDLHDWEAYERCFCDSLEVDFQRLTGHEPVLTSARAWTRFAECALGRLTVHHQYSNQAVTVSGDEASSVVYMVARHLNPDNASWNTQYGWYENTFARCDGGFGWQIKRLRHDFQWTSGVPDIIDMNDADCQQAMAEVFSPANTISQHPAPGDHQ